VTQGPALQHSHQLSHPQEDERATKRIAQTRQKVARITAVRAQAEQRAQAKSEWYDEQLHHLELQRQENARLKEQNIKAK
jgi:hypothetical protein